MLVIILALLVVALVCIDATQTFVIQGLASSIRIHHDELDQQRNLYEERDKLRRREYVELSDESSERIRELEVKLQAAHTSLEMVLNIQGDVK